MIKLVGRCIIFPASGRKIGNRIARKGKSMSWKKDPYGMMIVKIVLCIIVSMR
jgi:hypothetical protein